MHKVSINPQWTISDATGEALSNRLLGLLADVAEHGSLLRACKTTGCSYRHAWNLIRQGEAQLGTKLLYMEKGKGSTLTPIAEKLVWAGHRIAARLSPTLQTLASELETELSKVIASEVRSLSVYASHGFAVEKLIEALIDNGHKIQRKYVGSQEAVASLAAGNCQVAGFHVPTGKFEKIAYAHYSQWIHPKRHVLVNVATRCQGFMVAPGNPKHIYSVADLTQPGVKFVNRDPSSGTYFLLQCLLKDAGVDPQKINGFNSGEYTHAAVAAYVASGMADAGLAVETPSRRFKLGFVPLATERYFLLLNKEYLQSHQFQDVLAILSSASFKDSVNQLPGYDASQCAVVESIAQAFPDIAVS